MRDRRQASGLNRLFPAPSGGEGTVYRIGDLAREFNVTLRTLRFYEDRGLLHPQRRGSMRLYCEQDRARLKVILLAKQVGFPLVEIQEVLKIYDRPEDLDDAAGELLEKFTAQMNVLKSQKAEIEAAIDKLAEAILALRQS